LAEKVLNSFRKGENAEKFQRNAEHKSRCLIEPDAEDAMCVAYHPSRRAASTPSPARDPSASAGETHPARSGSSAQSNTLGPVSAAALSFSLLQSYPTALRLSEW